MAKPSNTETVKTWTEMTAAERGVFTAKHMPAILKAEKALRAAQAAVETARTELSANVLAFLNDCGDVVTGDPKASPPIPDSRAIPAFPSKHCGGALIQPVVRTTASGTTGFIKRLSTPDAEAC